MKDFFKNNSSSKYIILILIVLALSGIFFLLLSSENSNSSNEDQIKKESQSFSGGIKVGWFNIPLPAPFFQPKKSENIPVIKASPMQKTIVNKTEQKQVKKLKGIIDTIVLSDGSIDYLFSSPTAGRENEIIVKNGVVIFERIVLSEKKDSYGYIRIKDFTAKNGQPEKNFQGSKFYGPFTYTYVYSKGLAFIGNPYTNEVYEIQVFQPMTVDNYVRFYGGDIKPGYPKDP